jgi:polyvinyl alcohol dehydrogenase (cytochrome)
MLSSTAGGGLYALDVQTGEIAWHTPHPGCGSTPGCSPAQSAATTVIPGVVFSGGLDGHLRAYDTKDGRVIWDVDTGRPFQTVNGVEATGGSLDGSGPVVVNGTVYVNSGYFFAGHTPGNVLLAFSVAR